VVQLDHGQSFQNIVQLHIVQLSDQKLWPKKMYADNQEITSSESNQTNFEQQTLQAI
jgi:hypothetical protein